MTVVFFLRRVCRSVIAFIAFIVRMAFCLHKLTEIASLLSVAVVKIAYARVLRYVSCVE